MYSDFNEAEFRALCKSQMLPFDKDFKNFSTGMKAKVKVLVALSHNADLLIMDEPTSGLDIEARNEILDEMYAKLDKHSILKTKKTDYGYECFTGERQFYIDNYPGLVVENGNIAFAVIIIAITLIITMLSIICSIKIMKKREY